MIKVNSIDLFSRLRMCSQYSQGDDRICQAITLIAKAYNMYLMKAKIVAVLLYLTLTFSHTYHPLPQQPSSPSPFISETPLRGRLLTPSTTGRQAMRIRINTVALNNSVLLAGTNGAPTTTQANLNKLINALAVAENFFQTRLKVQPEGSITIPTTCIDVPISSGTDGSSDLVLFASYITDGVQSFSAKAGSCVYVSGTANSGTPDNQLKVNRPTVGRIIYNTYQIIDQHSTVTNLIFQSIVATTIHEIIHVLGFDSSRFGTWLDPALGYPYTTSPEQTNTTGIIHSSRPATKLLTTPFVKQWAQDHFNCSTLAGMPLENQDGSGIGAGSHWQRVAMYDQLMTATSFGATKGLSGLTFALLKDTGWYTVDDNLHQTTNYGYNMGCSFVNDACYSSTAYSAFCNATTQASISYCINTFYSKAICSNVSTMMADGCGLYAPYFNCIDPDASDSSGYVAYTSQTFSTTSFCVDSTLGTVTIPATLQSRCYPYACNSDSITFTIGSYQITCLSSETGVKKSLSALVGTLTCPSFESYCTKSRKTCKNWCSQNGFCMNGVCNCLQGYSGEDCSITNCTTASQFYDPTNNICITGTCPSGYYQNIYSHTCEQCNSPCSECIGTPDSCLGCASVAGKPQYFYNNICYETCPSNTYANNTGYTCHDCDNSTAFCQTCSGSPTNCTSCLDPYYLESSTHGACITNCSGTSNSLAVISTRVCVASCPSNMRSPGDGTCVLCSNGTYLFSGSCISNCSGQYYGDQTLRACLNCDSSCQTCDGSYPQNCTSCKPTSANAYLLLKMCWAICAKGFYANPSTNKCQVCPVSLRCTTCFYDNGTAAAVCSACEYNTFYTESSRTCETSCASTQYKNTWNNSCDACDGGCLTCNGPSSYSCTSCSASTYLLSNTTGGYCLSACPTSGYVQIGTTCQTCDATCQSCNGISASDCSTCASGYYLYGGYCRYVCPSKYYPDSATQQCLDCHTTCAYCFDGTVNGCSSCNGGLYLYNFTCTSSCPDSMTPNSYNVCFERWFEAVWATIGILCLLWL